MLCFLSTYLEFSAPRQCTPSPLVSPRYVPLFYTLSFGSCDWRKYVQDEERKLNDYKPKNQLYNDIIVIQQRLCERVKYYQFLPLEVTNFTLKVALMKRAVCAFFRDCRMTSPVNVFCSKWAGNFKSIDIGRHAALANNWTLQPCGSKAGQRHEKCRKLFKPFKLLSMCSA